MRPVAVAFGLMCSHCSTCGTKDAYSISRRAAHSNYSSSNYMPLPAATRAKGPVDVLDELLGTTMQTEHQLNLVRSIGKMATRIDRQPRVML